MQRSSTLALRRSVFSYLHQTAAATAHKKQKRGCMVCTGNRTALNTPKGKAAAHKYTSAQRLNLAIHKKNTASHSPLVTAVDDDVSRLHVLAQVVHGGVNRSACLHQQDHTPAGGIPAAAAAVSVRKRG
jgi:hypothetical protein